MKKELLLIAVVTFLTTAAFAQNKSVGISSGLSLGHFYTGRNAITDPSLAKVIGRFFYENRFKKHWAYELGVSYFGTGSIENTKDQNNIPIKLEWSYDYLSVPLSVKYILGNKIRPYGKVGFSIAYLLHSYGLPFITVRDVATIKYVNLKEETQTIDYGILAGFGLETQLNTAYQLGLEINAYYALANFDTYSSTLKQHYVSVELVFKHNINCKLP